MRWVRKTDCSICSMIGERLKVTHGFARSGQLLWSEKYVESRNSKSFRGIVEPSSIASAVLLASLIEELLNLYQ